MNSFKKTLLLILLLPLGCANANQKKAEEGEPVANPLIQKPYYINLPNGSSEGNLKLSDFSDRIEYIPLQTKKESLVRGIAYLQMNDSVIGISDMQKVLLFKRDGTFIRAIGRRGKGPQEYGGIYNFYFKADTIYIITVDKLLKFTMDGKFQREIKTNSLRHTTMDDKGNLVYYNEDNGELTFLNSSIKPVRKFIAIKNVTHGYWVIYDNEDKYFQPGKGKILFGSYKSDTLWDLASGKMKAEYILNLKEKLLPVNLQLGNFKGTSADFQKAAKPYAKMNMVEQYPNLFFIQKSWGTGKKTAIYLHNLNDHTTRKFDPAYLKDDIIGKIKIRPKLELSTENDIITYLRADELVSAIDSLSKQKVINEPKHNLWKSKMSKVKFDDNPILVIIKPRK